MTAIQVSYADVKALLRGISVFRDSVELAELVAQMATFSHACIGRVSATLVA